MVVDKKRIIGKMKGRGEGEAPHKREVYKIEGLLNGISKYTYV
jgi:hypothetical protein